MADNSVKVKFMPYLKIFLKFVNYISPKRPHESKVGHFLRTSFIGACMVLAVRTIPLSSKVIELEKENARINHLCLDKVMEGNKNYTPTLYEEHLLREAEESGLSDSNDNKE